MDDLLKSQIHQNCKLALPEGLKDLMSDISREVLRAQPQDLYQFIANYLGALLEARETLTIACQVCSDICKCTCAPIKPELYNELRNIGLDGEELESAIEVIIKHLEGDHEENESVKEQSLLLKLMKKVKINETQLPVIQQAIQKAFKRHCLSQSALKDFKNENNQVTSEAVHHTLHLYKQNKPSEAEDIFVPPDFKPCKSESLVILLEDNPITIIYLYNVNNLLHWSVDVTTVSSMSLAGSYVHLPKFQPYCAHDHEVMSLIPEKEHTLSIDNTKVENTAEIKQKKIKICDETVICDVHEEDYETDEFNTFLDYDNHGNEYNTNASLAVVDYTEATSSSELKKNKIEISEEITIEDFEETDKDTEILDGYSSSKNEEHSNDEVQEFIENYESGNESSFSTVADDIDD